MGKIATMKAVVGEKPIAKEALIQDAVSQGVVFEITSMGNVLFESAKVDWRRSLKR